MPLERVATRSALTVNMRAHFNHRRLVHRPKGSCTSSV